MLQPAGHVVQLSRVTECYSRVASVIFMKAPNDSSVKTHGYVAPYDTTSGMHAGGDMACCASDVNYDF